MKQIKYFELLVFSHSKIIFLIIVAICEKTQDRQFFPHLRLWPNCHERSSELAWARPWQTDSLGVVTIKPRASGRPHCLSPHTRPSWFKLSLPRPIVKQYLRISLGHKLPGVRSSRSGFSRAWHFVWCWGVRGTVKTCISECCQSICRSLLRTVCFLYRRW